MISVVKAHYQRKYRTMSLRLYVCVSNANWVIRATVVVFSVCIRTFGLFSHLRNVSMV